MAKYRTQAVKPEKLNEFCHTYVKLRRKGYNAKYIIPFLASYWNGELTEPWQLHQFIHRLYKSKNCPQILQNFYNETVSAGKVSAKKTSPNKNVAIHEKKPPVPVVSVAPQPDLNMVIKNVIESYMLNLETKEQAFDRILKFTNSRR